MSKSRAMALCRSGKGRSTGVESAVSREIRLMLPLQANRRYSSGPEIKFNSWIFSDKVLTWMICNNPMIPCSFHLSGKPLTVKACLSIRPEFDSGWTCAGESLWVHQTKVWAPTIVSTTAIDSWKLEIWFKAESTFTNLWCNARFGVEIT